MLCSIPVGTDKPLKSSDVIYNTEKILKDSDKTPDVFKDEIRSFIGSFASKLREHAAASESTADISQGGCALCYVYFVTLKQLEAFLKEALLRFGYFNLYLKSLISLVFVADL